MNLRPPVLLTSLLLLLSACSSEPKTADRLKEMEQEFKPAGSQPKVEQAAGSPQPADASTIVSKAMVAVKENQPAEGVMLLQTAQKLPNLNANQRMAVHNSIRAVTAELVEKASRGDTRAKEELKRIEAFLGQN